MKQKKEGILLLELYIYIYVDKRFKKRYKMISTFHFCQTKAVKQTLQKQWYADKNIYS